jgi:endonuclease/exonuclease/phosphatase family metal-dependent hydrolase
MAEILRWDRAFGCDVIALQECESSAGYEELLGSHELVGSAEAVATRGFVHLYARRGVKYERVEVDGAEPCVAMRVDFGDGEAPAQSLVTAAVHLPVGDCAGRRQRILEQVVAKAGDCEEKVLLVGDMNAKDDAEVGALCHEMRLQEARYAGASWGVKGNGFYKDSKYSGPGLRKDRICSGRRCGRRRTSWGRGRGSSMVMSFVCPTTSVSWLTWM